MDSRSDKNKMKNELFNTRSTNLLCFATGLFKIVVISVILSDLVNWENKFTVTKKRLYTMRNPSQCY